jgi:hypothetical protein
MSQTSLPTGNSPSPRRPRAPVKRALYILIHSTNPRSLRTVKDLISRDISGQSIWLLVWNNSTATDVASRFSNRSVLVTLICDSYRSTTNHYNCSWFRIRIKHTIHSACMGFLIPLLSYNVFQPILHVCIILSYFYLCFPTSLQKKNKIKVVASHGSQTRGRAVSVFRY